MYIYFYQHSNGRECFPNHRQSYLARHVCTVDIIDVHCSILNAKVDICLRNNVNREVLPLLEGTGANDADVGA